MQHSTPERQHPDEIVTPSDRSTRLASHTARWLGMGSAPQLTAALQDEPTARSSGQRARQLARAKSHPATLVTLPFACVAQRCADAQPKNTSAPCRVGGRRCVDVASALLNTETATSPARGADASSSRSRQRAAILEHEDASEDGKPCARHRCRGTRLGEVPFRPPRSQNRNLPLPLSRSLTPLTKDIPDTSAMV